METIITIELEKVNSKRFEKALNLMKSFPYFETEIRGQQEIYICHIKTIYDYINTYPKIEPLVHMVRNRKKGTVYLNGEKLSKYLIYFRKFQNEMDQKAIEKVSYDFRTFTNTNIANDIISLDEKLKYPIIYYPPIYSAFFAFAKSVNEKPFFCSCQKESIHNYLEMEEEMLRNYIREYKGPFSIKIFPKIIKKHYFNPDKNTFSAPEFKDDICHKCLEQVPKYNYCDPMYGSKFEQKYGWFIVEKYYKYGLVKYDLNNLNYANEKCPKLIYDILNLNKPIDDKYKEIERIIENIVREEFDVHLIGEKWISETIMFKILESMFSDCTVHRHHRPVWLKGLELDAFIPEKKIGFEYNGKQHYEAVDFFGGVERLEIQKEHDRKKLEICKEYGIDLIIIKYDEDLNTDLIKKKVSLVRT